MNCTNATTLSSNSAINVITSIHVVVDYQYHGGTNFGRTSGGPYITTSYDYDAPLDEYGEFIQYRGFFLRNMFD